MERLTIDDLARLAGVPVRTVRYYISEGLLPPPSSRGRAAEYDAGHLARLRLVRRLVERHVPLAEQRQRLSGLTTAEIEELLDSEERRDERIEQASQAPAPRAYIDALLDRAAMAPMALKAPRARKAPEAPEAPMAPAAAPARRVQRTSAAERTPEPAEGWRRWTLAPGVELHVHEDVARDHAPFIERLLAVSHTAPSSPV